MTKIVDSQHTGVAQHERYMLLDRDCQVLAGPLVGPPGLDFDALASEFRRERYAAADAAGEDYCWFSESDFVEWMKDKGLLAPLPTCPVTVEISTSREHQYVPSHWPLCPQCEAGRGEPELGEVQRVLNRAEWYRKCTRCGHAWGHAFEPHGGPMLADDGRATLGGCVPYALSQAGALEFDTVLAACSQRGWCASDGMHVGDALIAAADLGLSTLCLDPADVARSSSGKVTLRQMLQQLDPEKAYILGTREHWLAVVRGENRDASGTHLRAEVIACWEVAAARTSAAVRCP